VLLECRQLEREARAGPVFERRRLCRVTVAIVGADEALVLELADEALHRIRGLVVRGVVAPKQLVRDLLAVRAGDDALPDRSADTAQAVVRARLEVDENDLALDRLVNDVRAVHPMPHLHKLSFPFLAPRAGAPNPPAKYVRSGAFCQPRRRARRTIS